MKEKEDIGTLIRNELEGKSVEAPESTWKRVVNSMDRKKRKRRGFFLLLFSGLVLISLVLISNLWKTNERQNNETDKDNKLNPAVKDQLDLNSVEKNSIDTIVGRDTQILTDKEIDLKTTKSNKTEKLRQKKAGLDSFTESKTTYFYFRSSDNKNVVSQDKAVIDSLIKQDSISGNN